MNQHTKDLLTRCAKAGYSVVEIGKPFSDSIVASNPKKKSLPQIGNSSALWKILEDMGIRCGCGACNDLTHYHQANVTDLESGRYEYRRGTGWSKDGIGPELDLDKVYCHCGREAKIIQLKKGEAIMDVKVRSKTNLFVWPDKYWALQCARCDWEYEMLRNKPIPTLRNCPEMNPGMLLREVLRLRNKK